MLRDQPRRSCAIAAGDALVGPTESLDQRAQLRCVVAMDLLHPQVVAVARRARCRDLGAHIEVALLQRDECLPEAIGGAVLRDGVAENRTGDSDPCGITPRGPLPGCTNRVRHARGCL